MLDESDFYQANVSSAKVIGSIPLSSTSVIAAFSVNPDGEFVYANPMFLEIVGLAKASMLLDRNFRSDFLVHPADWEHWRTVPDGQPLPINSLRLKAADGREIVVKGEIWSFSPNASAPLQIFGAFIDISDTASLEYSLQEAARNEAMISLAGGMIHDFKNLLTVLVGNLYLVAEGVRDNPKLLDHARRARDVAKRSADLMRQLVAFSQPGSFEPQQVDLGRVLAKLKPLLECSLGRSIRIDLDICRDASAINASVGLLEGAIVNLVINARDAIEHQGRIKVSVQNVVPSAESNGSTQSRSGNFVCLAVEDDGIGIPEHLQERVFDPLFSTKTDAGGTGLGLSMVRRFAEGLGGHVKLRSEEGKGTKISLLLPASTGMPDDSAVLTMPLERLPGGDEQVLLASGDAELTKTIADCLSVLGYNVRTSGDSTEINRLVRTEAYQIAIIDSSTNHFMAIEPLIGQIQSAAREVALMMIVGADSVVRKERVNVPLLRKPFSLNDLAIAVRTVLDGRKNG